MTCLQKQYIRSEEDTWTDDKDIFTDKDMKDMCKEKRRHL